MVNNSGRFVVPQNRCRSLRILLCIRNYKSGAEICSPTPLCFGLQLCTSSFIILHRLVGLRLLRLCPFLVSEVEQEIYSARDSVPRPCNGFHPWTFCSLRSVLSDLLGSAMHTPHLLRHCFFHFLYKLSEHCKCFINRLSCCHIYTCTLKQ